MAEPSDKPTGLPHLETGHDQDAVPAGSGKQWGLRIKSRLFPPLTKEQIDVIETVKFPCC